MDNKNNVVQFGAIRELHYEQLIHGSEDNRERMKFGNRFSVDTLQVPIRYIYRESTTPRADWQMC